MESFDTELYLYDGASMIQLAYNDDYNGLNSRISYSVTSGASYFVKVRGLEGKGTGSYRFRAYF
jgi:hypothetical protein